MQTIVHITDLHHSREGSLKGDISRSFVLNAVSKLEELYREKALGNAPILVITGDIVQSGAEQPEGSDFLCLQDDVLVPLMTAMQIDSSRVVLCPGNHELDMFAVADEDKVRDHLTTSSKTLNSDLNTKLEGFFSFVESHGYLSVTSKSPRVATFKIDETDIAVINTLSGIYSDDKDLGGAFLTPSELSAGLETMADNSIVCMHHPVEWLNVEVRQPFVSLLGRKKCRLFTGHEHKPSAQLVQEGKNRTVFIRGGAAGETGQVSYFSLVNLSSTSEAITLRTFRSTIESGGFQGLGIEDSECYPETSRGYFQRTRAFLTTTRINDVANNVAGEIEDYRNRLISNVYGTYVHPPLAVFEDNELSSKACLPDRLMSDAGIVVLCGDELSGKTTLAVQGVYEANLNHDEPITVLFLDFRELETETIENTVVKRLRAAGCTTDEAKMFLKNRAVKIVIDNFSPSRRRVKDLFRSFVDTYPEAPIVLITAGGGHFSPSNAPNFLSDTTTYFRIQDVTRETAIRMATGMPEAVGVDGTRLAGRVFKSISSLGAPRNVFYVQHLIRMYVSDAAVEPLNQFLMQKKIITDSMSAAHKLHWPGVAYDADVIEMFIGEIAYGLYKRKASFVSQGELFTHIEEFRSRKGKVRKEFPEDVVFKVLKSSYLLREYEDGIGFMVTGLEDYFLAKHMTHDSGFRDYVLSEEGLLNLPSVAQLYVAQNPSESDRIEIIFGHIDTLVRELEPLNGPETEVLREAIEKARPKSFNSLKDKVVDRLNVLKGENEDPEITLGGSDSVVELGSRIKYSQEERAAIYIQLGASVIGVTRTLDAKDRKALFVRLKPLLVIAMKSASMLAQHLADGNTIKLRGTTIKANYVGALKEDENRFYLILAGMLANLSNSFGTWSGSLSFYASAEELLADETDPLICAALLSQQVEADCEAAFSHITSIADKLAHPALMGFTIENFLDGIRMSPPEAKETEKQALHQLAEVVAIMDPPKLDGYGGKSKIEDETRQRAQRVASIYQTLEQKVHISAQLGKRIRRVKESDDS